MAFVGDFRNLRNLSERVADLARAGSKARKDISNGVGLAVRYQIQVQFATGTGPDAREWTRTKRGKLALVSRKLPQDFAWRAESAGLIFYSRVPWLRAHHDGHRFPAHNAAARSAAVDAIGSRFVKFKELRRALRTKNVERIDSDRGSLWVKKFKNKSKLLVRSITIREHAVGARILPARPIYPTGKIPEAWAVAMNRGAQAGFEKWAEHAALKAAKASK